MRLCLLARLVHSLVHALRRPRPPRPPRAALSAVDSIAAVARVIRLVASPAAPPPCALSLSACAIASTSPWEPGGDNVTLNDRSVSSATYAPRA